MANTHMAAHFMKEDQIIFIKFHASGDFCKEEPTIMERVCISNATEESMKVWRAVGTEDKGICNIFKGRDLKMLSSWHIVMHLLVTGRY